MQMGSLAEWFSAVGTIGTVIISLVLIWLNSSTRYKISVRKVIRTGNKGNKITKFKFAFINKNSYPMEIQLYGYKFFKYRCSIKPFDEGVLIYFEDGEKIIKSKHIDTHEDAFAAMDLISDKFSAGRGKFFAKAYLLDATGKYSKSKKFKFDFKEMNNDVMDIM